VGRLGGASPAGNFCAKEMRRIGEEVCLKQYSTCFASQSPDPSPTPPQKKRKRRKEREGWKEGRKEGRKEGKGRKEGRKEGSEGKDVRRIDMVENFFGIIAILIPKLLPTCYCLNSNINIVV
jgi:hypothetical protein